MRTLLQRLHLPQAVEVIPDETAYAIYLPRRATRRLYQALALVLGLGGGITYARLFLVQQGPLWTVAAGLVGAVLGFVLVLMPAALLHELRKVWTRLLLGRRERAYARRLARVEGRLRQRAGASPDDAEAMNALGAVQLLRGDTAHALQTLQRACALGAANGCRVNRAAALAEAGEFAAAADDLAAAAEDPECAAAAQHNIGVLLSHRPPLPVARRFATGPDGVASAATLNSLGEWQLSAGHLDAAERYFARAVEMDVATVAPRVNLALVQYRRGKLRTALQRAQEAAALDPANPVLANDLGVLLCAGGKPVLAARQLSRAAALAPGSPAVELNRGVVRLMLGQHEEGLDSFAEPTVRQAYPVLAAHNSALALIGLERLQAALQQLESGLDHDAKDLGLRNNLACVCWALGDRPRMVRELSSAAQAGVDDVGILLNLASARVEMGDTAGALEMLREVARDRAHDPDVLFAVGTAYLADALRLYSRQMNQQARQEFFRALHRCLKPLETVATSNADGAVEAAANLALYRYLRLEFEAAAAGFEAAAAQYPQDGYLRFCAGTALLEAGLAVQEAHDADELVGQARDLLRRARRHLEAATGLPGADADVFCNLGICAYNLGDLHDARAAFRRMVQLEESAHAANNLAIAHAREAQKLQHEARAAALVNRERERELLQSAQSHISNALEYFGKALEQMRDDPVLHGNIGLAHMLRNRPGDVEAALGHWQIMQQLGGQAVHRRYEELTALAQDEGAKAAFDETIMTFRPLDPSRSLVAMPPRLVGPRYALQTLAEELDWHLVSTEPAVRDALRERERVAGLRKRLARLSL